MPKFLFRRGRFHGSHRADVRAFLSTGCHRGTRGEFHQIDCGVTIPIVDDATLLTPLLIDRSQWTIAAPPTQMQSESGKAIRVRTGLDATQLSTFTRSRATGELDNRATTCEEVSFIGDLAFSRLSEALVALRA
jgi:hypothetical protein